MGHPATHERRGTGGLGAVGGRPPLPPPAPMSPHPPGGGSGELPVATRTLISVDGGVAAAAWRMSGAAPQLRSSCWLAAASTRGPDGGGRGCSDGARQSGASSPSESAPGAPLLPSSESEAPSSSSWSLASIAATPLVERSAKAGGAGRGAREAGGAAMRKGAVNRNDGTTACGARPGAGAPGRGGIGEPRALRCRDGAKEARTAPAAVVRGPDDEKSRAGRPPRPGTASPDAGSATKSGGAVEPGASSGASSSTRKSGATTAADPKSSPAPGPSPPTSPGASSTRKSGGPPSAVMAEAAARWRPQRVWGASLPGVSETRPAATAGDAGGGCMSESPAAAPGWWWRWCAREGGGESDEPGRCGSCSGERGMNDDARSSSACAGGREGSELSGDPVARGAFWAWSADSGPGCAWPSRRRRRWSSSASASSPTAANEPSTAPRTAPLLLGDADAAARGCVSEAEGVAGAAPTGSTVTLTATSSSALHSMAVLLRSTASKKPESTRASISGAMSPAAWRARAPASSKAWLIASPTVV